LFLLYQGGYKEKLPVTVVFTLIDEAKISAHFSEVVFYQLHKAMVAL
jgi:hypothetical protein